MKIIKILPPRDTLTFLKCIRMTLYITIIYCCIKAYPN